MKKLILSLTAALTVLAVNADVKNAKPVFELNCNAGDFSLLRDISPNSTAAATLSSTLPDKAESCLENNFF